MDVIVIYDIATPDPAGQRRLARVAKVCEGYGVRVQKSVFECRITEAKYVELEFELRQVIDPRLDRLTVYRVVGAVETIRTELGKVAGFNVDNPWVI